MDFASSNKINLHQASPAAPRYYAHTNIDPYSNPDADSRAVDITSESHPLTEHDGDAFYDNQRSSYGYSSKHTSGVQTENGDGIGSRASLLPPAQNADRSRTATPAAHSSRHTYHASIDSMPGPYAQRMRQIPSFDISAKKPLSSRQTHIGFPLFRTSIPAIRLLNIITCLCALFCAIAVHTLSVPWTWVLRAVPLCAVFYNAHGLVIPIRRLHQSNSFGGIRFKHNYMKRYSIYACVVDTCLMLYFLHVVIVTSLEKKDSRFGWAGEFPPFSHDEHAKDIVVFSEWIVAIVAVVSYALAIVGDVWILYISREIKKSVVFENMNNAFKEGQFMAEQRRNDAIDDGGRQSRGVASRTSKRVDFSKSFDVRQLGDDGEWEANNGDLGNPELTRGPPRVVKSALKRTPGVEEMELQQRQANDARELGLDLVPGPHSQDSVNSALSRADSNGNSSYYSTREQITPEATTGYMGDQQDIRNNNEIYGPRANPFDDDDASVNDDWKHFSNYVYEDDDINDAQSDGVGLVAAMESLRKRADMARTTGYTRLLNGYRDNDDDNNDDNDRAKAGQSSDGYVDNRPGSLFQGDQPKTEDNVMDQPPSQTADLTNSTLIAAALSSATATEPAAAAKASLPKKTHTMNSLSVEKAIVNPLQMNPTQRQISCKAETVDINDSQDVDEKDVAHENAASVPNPSQESTGTPTDTNRSAEAATAAAAMLAAAPSSGEKPDTDARNSYQPRSRRSRMRSGFRRSVSRTRSLYSSSRSRSPSRSRPAVHEHNQSIDSSSPLVTGITNDNDERYQRMLSVISTGTTADDRERQRQLEREFEQQAREEREEQDKKDKENREREREREKQPEEPPLNNATSPAASNDKNKNEHDADVPSGSAQAPPPIDQGSDDQRRGRRKSVSLRLRAASRDKVTKAAGWARWKGT